MLYVEYIYKWYKPALGCGSGPHGTNYSMVGVARYITSMLLGDQTEASRDYSDGAAMAEFSSTYIHVLWHKHIYIWNTNSKHHLDWLEQE